ncbi:MAG: hypothetical protein GYA52_03645 [Chloroflexi bacterium]|nr:hypothetical protein [Chloroflexota bacterium]
MAQVEKVENVSFPNPKDGYLKTLEILPELGMDIWKTREIANLILARKKKKDHQIQCNIIFNLNNTVSITLESEQENEVDLQSLAEQIFNAIAT